jgi:hypothetical protein
MAETTTGPFTVTFDTNTLASAVSPATAQRNTGPAGAVVHDAIRAGCIQGFFSETLITLEGIENNLRAEVLGRTRVISNEASNDEGHVTLSIGVRHERNPLNAQFSERIRAALDLGMRPLRTAARIGGYHLRGNAIPLYEPFGGMPELIRSMDRVNALTTEIGRRGVGQAAAIKLGLQFSARDNAGEPELWLQGLGRARDGSERTRVARVVREWADGDSIAAHYGFGIELICTDDFGQSGTSPSILDTNNRQWLSSTFGINFLTLSELARKVSE